MLRKGDTVYLSGPMSGMPDNNQALFDTAQAHLLSKGLRVINPCELGRQDGEVLNGDGWSATDDEYETYLERDMTHIKESDGLVLLKGWSFSGGSGREGRLAIAVGVPLYLLWREDEDWYPLLRIDNQYYLTNSTTRRLRPHVALHARY